jgi:hypothetical protein
MRHAHLITHEFESTGDLGFLLDRTPIFDDLLEHQNGSSSIGPDADEMETFGGVWLVRRAAPTSPSMKPTDFRITAKR